MQKIENAMDILSTENVLECQNYFKSYENFGVHRIMLEDKPRTESYRNAILSSSETFKDKVVMDVGAGTGILSIFCAQAGAKKVYAVEASNLAIITKQIVVENELDHIIEVLHCKVEEVSEHVKVDILVSEWMGFFLLHESMIDSVIYARDRHLNPGGIIYPDRAVLKCCPCSTPKLLDFWDDVYGAKMSAMKKAIRQSLVTKPEITALQPEDVLCEARTVLSIDMNTAKVHNVMQVKSRVFISTVKAGVYQGVSLWFDVTFPNDTKVNETLILSTSPMAPLTHWQQTVVVWPHDQIVEEGDILAFEIDFERNGASARTYSIHLRELDASSDEHPLPCECGTARCRVVQAFLASCQDDDSECEVTSDPEETVVAS